MKALSILGGKVHVVELQEGAPIPDVINTGRPHLSWLDIDIDLSEIDLPPGTWQIVGMLPEVTEKQVGELVQKRIHPWDHKLWTYRDYTREHKFPRDAVVLHTALQSLESAIVAEGWYLDDNPIKVHTWASENADDYKKQYDAAQSRVLCRERCLLLRRMDG